MDFTPRKNTSYNRHKFHRDSQTERKNVTQFVTQLRQLAKLCEFGDHIDDFIRDQVIRSASSHDYVLDTRRLVQLSDFPWESMRQQKCFSMIFKLSYTVCRAPSTSMVTSQCLVLTSVLTTNHWTMYCILSRRLG